MVELGFSRMRPKPRTCCGQRGGSSTPGNGEGGSQLLHFVFVFLEFSVHHFESSEEVPEEEQQKRESQHENLRRKRKKG